MNIGETCYVWVTGVPTGYQIPDETTFTMDSEGKVTYSGETDENGVLLVKICNHSGNSNEYTDCTKDFVCSVCNALLTEAKAHSEETVPGYDATCTEPGLTDGVICSTCGKTLTAQEEIPAPGHAWNDATCTYPKTCSTCGATEGEALGHSYDASGDCVNCDAVAVAVVTTGNTTTYYLTLDAAISAVSTATAEDEAAVKLLADIDLGDDHMYVKTACCFNFGATRP